MHQVLLSTLKEHELIWSCDRNLAYPLQSNIGQTIIYLYGNSGLGVVVSRGYDICFSVKACDGLYQLLKSTRSGWNTIRVSIDRVDLKWNSPHRQVTLRGACFRESLVIRLYSEIGQIHLSIEAQCGTPVYLWMTATLGDTLTFVFKHIKGLLFKKTVCLTC